VSGGAVAYLTHSQYGRNGNEIAKNDSSGYYTGRSLGSPSTESKQYSTQGTYKYNVVEGMLASTSGNIYGIYDTSGGLWEYTAAWDTESTNGAISSYGSSFASEKGESTKYATVYHNGTINAYPTKEKCILGDATYETLSWFDDKGYCVSDTKPFFIRGGFYSDTTDAGVFTSNNDDCDYVNMWMSFRVAAPGGEILDETAPTIKSVMVTSGREDGFTVSIDAEDNFGGLGIAKENAYTIYYRKKGESTYQSITTSKNVYEFTGLATTIETTQAQANSPKLKEGMNPVIWVDLNRNGTIEEETEEITKYTNLAKGTINPKWTENNGDSQWSYYNQVVSRNL